MFDLCVEKCLSHNPIATLHITSIMRDINTLLTGIYMDMKMIKTLVSAKFFCFPKHVVFYKKSTYQHANIL